ncbi:MAG: ribosome assembly cofactor RimP [Bacteroidetes bacterium]|nr:ribosome assembly cofactor RimP [Bacteroidota bacterium]
MITEKKVSLLIQDYLKESDKFLIEVLIKPLNHIMVFIDGDHGVAISDCQKLSRYIEQHLDREQEDFDLMVSSAGADRPFRVPRQYQKYLQKRLEVVTISGAGIEGTLLQADSNGIKFEQEIKISKKDIEKKIVELTYSEIKSAKAVLNFKRS